MLVAKDSRHVPSARADCFILLAVPSEGILDRKPPAADLRFSYGTDANQFADVRIPAGKAPFPVVFFIHGGYWRSRYDLVYAGHACEALKKSGIATWNVEYRRVGNPGGGWPGTFEDIRNAYRALIESQESTRLGPLDIEYLCVAGHSAGGQLALCLAAHEKTVTRVVSLAGVLDLRRGWELGLSKNAVAEFLGGSPREVPEHYHEASPWEQHIPQAIQKVIHGTIDDSVPYEISKSYVDRKKKLGEQVEMMSFENTGHFEIVDPEAAVWPKVAKTFHSLTAH